MKKTIVVVGFGPGISSAVAQKFGAEGFAVALVARNEERLDAGVKALQAKGVEAAAFVADAGNPASIRAAIDGARKALGPVAVVLWNAYAMGTGDLTTASADDVRAAFDVPVVGLVAALQAALPDLKAEKGSFLVTNGGLAFAQPEVDKIAVTWGAMGLAVANAAKHKLVGVLAEKLRPEGVYVGEVMVQGTIKGSAFDRGDANLDASKVSDAFWKLHAARTDVRATVS